MKHSSKRILITGASGFLGTALRDALIDEDCTVLGTSTQGSQCSIRPCFEWELTRPQRIESILEAAQPDQVIHLASPVDPRRDPGLIDSMNAAIVEGGKVLALACEAHGVPLLAAGTCEEYGNQEGPYSESMHAPGVSPYSMAKAQLTKWLMDRHESSSLDVTLVRPFLTYGPGQTAPRLVPAAIRAALRGEVLRTTHGQQTRELNYISDMVRGFQAVLRSNISGEILNLGGGSEHTIREVVERIYTLAEANPDQVNWGALPYRAGEVQRFVGDHRKTRSLLDFEPEITLEEGLRATIAWWRTRAYPED